MNFEDHFSELAETYSKYRPQYPSALFEYLANNCKEHSLAWDCGTGNGQAAIELAKYFDKVLATDASRDQLKLAQQHSKITYRVETAEKVSLENSSTDLITVAVAVHWFDFEKFYSEVKRVLKPTGIIAVWAYHIFDISPEINSIIEKYYYKTLDGYWPERFQYLDKRYKTLPFPFKEIIPPKFEMTTEWNMNQVLGFLNSWSGTKNYSQKNDRHPLNEIWDDLKKAWGDEKIIRGVNWPLNIRVGKKV